MPVSRGATLPQAKKGPGRAPGLIRRKRRPRTARAMTSTVRMKDGSSHWSRKKALDPFSPVLYAT